MAGKKNMKNGNKHKRGGNKRGGNGSRANYKLAVQVPALRVRLPYSYQGGLQEGAAAIGIAYTFRANDVFDPDFSGGGLQPLGLDQYAQFYGRYHVWGFRYEVTFSTRTGAPIYVGAHMSAQSTLPAVAVSWFVQNATVKTRSLGGNAGSNNIAVIRGRANLPEVLGVKPKEYSDQDFSAVVTSNPARVAYLHVWIVGRSAIAVADISVRLWYDVEFSQPVALGMS